MAQTAAVIGLSATGPQDQYIFDEKKNPLRPSIRQYTHFTKFHRTTYPQVSQFVGQTVEFLFKPKELGDLWHNAYLALTLPQLPQVSGQSYGWSPQIGRAIIEHIEFRIGNQVIEKIDDYWYTVRDQLFLDADSKLALYQVTNGGQNETVSCPSSQPVDLMIPLELFFCRRHTFTDARRDLLERPPLPVCALKEFISIKFFFRPQNWFTNYPQPIEFTNVRLVTEEILLTDEERLYYQGTPFRSVINVSKNDAVTNYQNGKPTHYFTADFPVTMMVWFVRDANYESVSTNAYYASRYAYGYTTDYITITTPVTFFDGTTNKCIDVLESTDIFINGRNLMGPFATGVFYQYKQPMDNGLSIPSKSMYTYCWGKSPKEYNQGGYLNFENIDSKTSKIVLSFYQQYSPNIQANYKINLFYYGYRVLSIANGRATLI